VREHRSTITEALPKNLLVSGNNEQKLLGALFLSTDRRDIDKVFAKIQPEYISNQDYATIFDIVRRLHAAERPHTIEFVYPLLIEETDLSGDDAAQLLLDAAESCFRSAYLQDYARATLRVYQQREMIYGMRELDQSIASASLGFEEAAAKLQETLNRVRAMSADEDEEDPHISSMLTELLNQSEESEEVFPFGITELDKVLRGGLRRQDLAFVGARAGVGKSLLKGQFAMRNAQMGRKTSYMNYEMRRIDMMKRWAKQGGFNINDEFDTQRINDLGLFYHRSGSWNINRIEDEARRSVEDKGISIVVIDYLGLIPQVDNRDDNLRHFSDCTRRLKTLAMDSNIVVLVGCQFNRKKEGRDDPRPRMSDFRDSGTVAQDADVLIGLHRDKLPEKAHEATCYVMKQRNGGEADIPLMLHSEYAKFVEPAEGYEAPGW